MTCTRHYSPATVTDLQQIAANIEAERRRQYRAEMAQELRTQLSGVIEKRRETMATTEFIKGWEMALFSTLELVDRLSPPVVCDATK